MIEMHVLAPLHLTQLVLPAMRERKQGWVLNMTSIAGDRPPGPPFSDFDVSAGFGMYGTAKAALDRLTVSLAADPERTVELFGFDYQLEMYKPAAKRRWGYFALPILYGDRLVGKLDATADRDAGVLRVDAVHQDVPFDRAMTAAVDGEIKDLAHWLELDLKVTT